MYEGAIQDLIDALGRLPGIGPKSAQRIAFHILQTESEVAVALVEAIIDPSVDGTPQAKGGPTKGESLDDPQAPSGLSLLASELGAEVIKVEEHD